MSDNPTVEDPGPPPEGDYMKAADLKNKPLLVKPTGTGWYDAKHAVAEVLDSEGNVVTEAREAQGPSEYVECDVWVLDRAGVIEEGTGVRVGWWKAVGQLKEKMGKYVGGVPKKETGSNSIVFTPLDDAHKKVAAQVVKDIHDTRPM